MAALNFTGTAFRASATKVIGARKHTDMVRDFIFRQGEPLPLLVNHGGSDVGFVRVYTVTDSTGPTLRAIGVVYSDAVAARIRSGELLGLSVGIAKTPATIQNIDASTRVLGQVRPSEVSLVSAPASADAWIAEIDGRAVVNKSPVRQADDRERDRVAHAQARAQLERMLDAEHAEIVRLRALGYRT